MARRRMKHVRVGKCSVSIHKDSESYGFVVTTKAPRGECARGCTGEESDMRSARATAAQSIKWLRRQGVCR